jgi:ATP-dependent DNA helicase RecQ
LQAIQLEDQAERLAWMATHLPGLPGSGIVYCLTVADSIRVAKWLSSQGIEAEAYYGDLDHDERIRLEQALLQNRLKALVSTVALGMGFDKPDLGFVVHFQRPGSIVSYYQQIGRAGRSSNDAYAILLNGREDDEIQQYFIDSAFPTDVELERVVHALEEFDTLKLSDIERSVNMPRGRIEKALKTLSVDGVVAKDGSAGWFRTTNAWKPDRERAALVTAERKRELARMQDFVQSESCYMEFIARELDDPSAKPCGNCSVCRGGPLIPIDVAPAALAAAISFLKRSHQPIGPRTNLPAGLLDRSRIAPEERSEVGIALCIYGDAGWGRSVISGKYQTGRFDDALVVALAEAVRSRDSSLTRPEWVTAVPSLRHPFLVPDLATRLAEALNLPFSSALEKAGNTPEQKSMENSYLQAENALAGFRALPDEVLPGPVLLVDDIVDSKWTLTVCGILLRQSGSGPVIPATLACMPGVG